MKCTINGIVKYNSDDGTLLGPDNTIGMLKLARVVNDLLLLLVENNNALLSRETLLSELWEKRGLNASSNNLSNYISILRKTLGNCGCPGLITTVPKHGFVFKADITIQTDIDDNEPILSVVNNEEVSLVPNKVEKGKRLTFHPWLKVGRPWLCSLVILALLILLTGAYEEWSIKSARTKILTIGQCDFYIMDDVTRSLENANTPAIIKKIVNQENLNCKRKANVYYFYYEEIDAYGEVLMSEHLAYCPYGGKAPCDNYIVSKRESKNEDK
jgi:DNA-binding winged helix-turn-helix (wHTH) protein